MVLRFRQINRNTFEAIRNGKKKVETRAATTKYADIKKDDMVKFVCGSSSFIRKVKKVQKFKTVDLMLKKYKVKDINPFIKTKEELLEKYYSFPGYKEKIKRYGLIAFEL